MISKSAIFIFISSCLALPPLGHAGDNRTSIHVAVRAHAGAQHAMQKWGPTLDYLNQVLPAYRFEMIPYTSLKQQLRDAKRKKFEFLLTNPSTYVELAAANQARALLTLINKRRDTAQTRFGSVIFTHVDHTDILRLEDLKQKKFMAVNRLGFGGWRVGLKVLLEHGITPKRDFANLQFAGKQPAVVKAVLEKTVHAGMVRTDTLERLVDQGKLNLRNVRILNPQTTTGFPFFHSSPLYPEWPFAVMTHTPPPLAEGVRQALLKLDKAHSAARAGQYIGWTEALDYRPVEQLLADLGVAPFARRKPGNMFIYLLLAAAGLLIAFYAVSRYIRK